MAAAQQVLGICSALVMGSSMGIQRKNKYI
jgi:hypothetical protein